MSPYTCEPPSHPHTFTSSHLHPRQVDAPREQISDAVAVYFVMPTVDNVSRICQDCRAQLYERYYLNFITAIPRPLLEEVAKATLEANSVAQIGKVSVCVCVCVCVCVSLIAFFVRFTISFSTLYRWRMDSLYFGTK